MHYVPGGGAPGQSGSSASGGQSLQTGKQLTVQVYIEFGDEKQILLSQCDDAFELGRTYFSCND